MVTLPASVLSGYERFSRYNSPYPAHDRGCAIDLYPGENGGPAPSPVAGEVIDTRTVRCPPRPYAVDTDHLILVDTGEHVARILHVDPAVGAGDEVAVGDSLGRLVRSGFFGRWVDDHVHLGFRAPDANPYRASGSLPLAVDCAVSPLAWDGTGEIVEVGETHVRLDTPVGGDGFAALASDEGIPLDGGLAHYTGAGTFGLSSGTLSLLGTEVATESDDGLVWRDVAVTVDGVDATGLSLFATQIEFGAKLVFHEGHDFVVGESVRVAIDETADPIRLG
ncbi:hypothetical protein DM867_04085 [Halosegnis rubeus]|jgi:hypothetical protein|uniref:Peptidase family M23 n=1 Tax=Halosegnis rubeus TaxID=2212850 RepID=A0A5N5UG62_9EURY|nr:hypothetical protein [Halosegnis rubeus]KAB7515262.1 hypothetical protein DMP03_08465 [Halosegnis rubeus]KAB7516316.1 hypothetical protein DM867_04085 [Halosegnis rubeus]KAB7517696.1 hypothetical protein DP108_09035 [Halosegnis rubeus]